MRVLVTGATGFLGAHVCRALQATGHEPIAGLRMQSRSWRLDVLAPGIGKLEFDLLDDAATLRAVSAVKPDAVVNCAGYGVNYGEQDFDLAYRTNVGGALGVAVAAAAVGARMLQIGSSYEYGSFEQPLGERAPLAPHGIYGVSKAAATMLVGEFARSKCLQGAILRLFSLYGPLEGRHKLVPSAMLAQRAGMPLDLTPGGQVRDYVYVADAARAIVLCLMASPLPAHSIVNIASGQPVTLRTIVEAAVGGFDGLHWGAKPYRENELMNVVGRPDRATELLGWRSSTSLAAGMAETRRFEDSRSGEA